MKLERDGKSIVLILDHEDIVNTLAPSKERTLNNLSDVLTGVTRKNPIEQAYPPLAPLVTTLGPIIEVMDQIGGNDGVELSGQLDSAIWLVMPKANGLLGTVISGVQDISRIVAHYADSLSLLHLLGITPLATFGSHTGEVHFDKNQVGSKELLIMVATTNRQVGLLSANGYYSVNPNNQLVIANRPHLQAYETWKVRYNDNGSVSFQSTALGTWLRSDRDHYKRMSADQTEISSWGKFTIVPLGSGKIALRDAQGQYASITA